MDRSLHKWMSVSLFNLMLVAFLGCILRYKIAYWLPFIDQKYLLHAHSHFAFTGWVSQALMSLMIKFISDKTGKDAFKQFDWILWANLVAAYGMLFTFPFEGYAAGSIAFSTLSVFTGYAFAVLYWKELNRIPSSVENLFFKAALFFNVLSSAGTFAVAYLMATKSSLQHFFLAAVYFFLHFQYNGWFLFACMGLFCADLVKYAVARQPLRVSFYFFACACFPAYLLSALWIPMPEWVYLIVALAAIAQLVAWGIMMKVTRQKTGLIKSRMPGSAGKLFFLCAIAYTIKLLLQAASAIPSLSYLTYGFRPIVIGYLHLVLLGVVSLFIITYGLGNHFFKQGKQMKSGILIFVAGIIVNELLLMIQGIGDLGYFLIPYINEGLLAAAVTLFCGALVMNLGNWQLKKHPLPRKRRHSL